MSKELMLSEVADFCRAAATNRSPQCSMKIIPPVSIGIRLGGPFIASVPGPPCSGAHYDYIDFSITVGSEAGTRASRRDIRSWMQYLSEFMAGLDFVHSKLEPEWITAKPDHLVASVLSVGSQDYVAYLADAREVTDSSASQPISGQVGFALPAGNSMSDCIRL